MGEHSECDFGSLIGSALSSANIKSNVINIRIRKLKVVIIFNVLGTVRVGRMFLKSIGVVAMIIDFTSHENRTSLMCFW